MTTIKATVTQNGKTLAKVTPQQNILVTNYQVSTSNITLDDLVALSVIENPNTEVNGGFF